MSSNKPLVVITRRWPERVEARLQALIGEAAGRLHTARSRNDQVALDFRMWVRSTMEGISESLDGIITALLEKLKKDTELMSDQEFQNLLQEISVKRGQMAQLLQELQRVKLEQTDRLIQTFPLNCFTK